MLRKVQKGNTTYVAYDIDGSNVEFDEVSIMMINNNRNKKTGLAPIVLESMNGVCNQLLFDITGKVSISEYLQENHTQTEFKNLILSLVETIECFDEYMIETSRIMFNLDSVYINMTDGTISFICIAIMGYTQRKTMYDFFKDVVADCYLIDDNSGLRYYDNVRNVMRTQGGFSLENIKKSLGNPGKVGSHRAYEPAPESFPNPAPEPVPAHTPAPNPVPDNIPGSAPGTTVLFGTGNREGYNERDLYDVRGGYGERGPVTVSSETELDRRKVPDAVEEVPAEKTKKGILGNIFGGGKKKKKSEPTAPKFQSGLMGLKNGNRPGEPVNEVPPVQPEENIYQPINPRPGTTVLTDPATPPRGNDTTVLNNAEKLYDSPATTVLINGENPSNPRPKPYAPPPRPKQAFLIRLKNGQRFHIDKDLTRIGRNEPNIDVSVADNTAVGRRHASILKKGNGYYLVDLNSTNHTYVNGVMLQGGQEQLLFSGDIVIFADEEFRFIIE